MRKVMAAETGAAREPWRSGDSPCLSRALCQPVQQGAKV